MYELEKQAELEQLAVQRMRVAELAAKRQSIDALLDSRAIALDTIQDERNRRYGGGWGLGIRGRVKVGIGSWSMKANSFLQQHQVRIFHFSLFVSIGSLVCFKTHRWLIPSFFLLASLPPSPSSVCSRGLVRRSDTSSVDSLQHLLAKAELLERELSSGAYDARARALYANQVQYNCCLRACVQS